jgi:CheY-like chemotaxis protein
MGLCFGSQVGMATGVAFYSPVVDVNSPDSSPEDACGIDQSLSAPTLPGGIFCAQPSKFSCGISQSLPAAGIAQVAPFSAGYGIRMPAPLRVGGARMGGERTTGVLMRKAFLVSVVEDDRFFRESMRRLMESLDHSVEAFSSAADFLASPRLVETACLIADVNMPAMTGIELYKRLIETGHAIPTILVTAYPDDEARALALKDGVICYLRKPIDEEQLKRCLRAALSS